MDYTNLAKQILNDVGGNENIQSVMHCYTRLRFVLKDEAIADANRSQLEQLSGVSGVVKSNGQFQVIIGNHVDDVFQALERLRGNQPKPSLDTDQKKKLSLIDFVNAVFMPVMGVLCATGMIKGIITALGTLGVLDMASNTYVTLLALGDTVLYFFPVFLGYTAMKRFGGTPFIGMALGAALIYPTIVAIAQGDPTGTLFSQSLLQIDTRGALFGIPFVAMNYSTTVFPVIISAYAAAKLENFVKTWMPKVLASFMTPAIVLIVIFPLTLLIIGPIINILSTLVAGGISSLQNFNTVIAAIILGVSWQILIMFGLHGMVFPIIFMNFQMFGYDTVFTAAFVCSFTQVAACFAVALKEKRQDKKSTAISAGISALFGITEPAIYGVALPSKQVFISTCIASGIGAGIMGLAGVKMYVLGGMGIFGFFNFVSPDGTSYLIQVVVSTLVAMVVSFLLTWFWGYRKSVDTQSEKQELSM